LSIVRLANLGVHSIKKAIRSKGGWEGFLPPLCLSAKRICQKLLVALSPSPTTASINLIRFLALTHPTPTLCLIYELYKLSLSACAVFYLLKRAGVRACEKFEVSPPHVCACSVRISSGCVRCVAATPGSRSRRYAERTAHLADG
jgi:hypothetical protein